MKVKIEFDLGEVARCSQESVYTAVDHLFDSLSLEIAQPLATGGDIMVRAFGLPNQTEVNVGQWSIE